MKNLKLITTLTILSLFMCSCNTCTRNWGGITTISLSTNQRLVNVTWKSDDLWILCKYDTTKAQDYTFEENSNFGVMQGKVVIKEQ